MEYIGVHNLVCVLDTTIIIVGIVISPSHSRSLALTEATFLMILLACTLYIFTQLTDTQLTVTSTVLKSLLMISYNLLLNKNWLE